MIRMTADRRHSLSEFDMRIVLVQTSKKLFGSEVPVIEEIYGARFLPALPVAVFARGRLDAGMNDFFCRVLGLKGAAGARSAASFMEGYEKRDTETIAVSLVSVLMNTRSESAFFLCLETAQGIRRVSGRDTALAFIKQCALRDFDRNAIKECAALFRDRYACELAGHILERSEAAEAHLNVQSFFHSILRIAATGGFEDRAKRRELSREFAATIGVLLANCPEAAGVFAEDFSAVIGESRDFGTGMRLARNFRNGPVINELRQLRGDVEKIEEKIAEFLYMEL